MKTDLAWSSVFEAKNLRSVPQNFPTTAINPQWAWGASTGAGVRVAVIDGGVDATHPAVGGNVAGYVSITEGPGGLVYDTTPHGDSYGHGTACAGIIRAAAPDCELYSVRVLGPGLVGRAPIFAASLQWAIDHGIQVCNLSLGTTKKEFFAIFHELVDRAYFRNIMLVTAANNIPLPSFPSLYAAVISVAAHGLKDPNVFYYNPEPPVEFGAPGISVRVPWVNGGWITASGNSFATPHITGIVTKILSQHPGLTLFEMKTILRALATNVEGPTLSTAEEATASG